MKASQARTQTTQRYTYTHNYAQNRRQRAYRSNSGHAETQARLVVAAESLSIGSLYVSTLQLRAKSLLISARVATAAPRHTSQDHKRYLLLQALTARVIAIDLLLLSCILVVIQKINLLEVRRARHTLQRCNRR